jgi:hypothetical protein
MPTRDTAQLILEVDARIATAQRAVNQLARSIQQDAAGMDGGLKKIEQSGERVAKSLGGISGRTRSGFTQLSFQIGDVTQGSQWAPRRRPSSRSSPDRSSRPCRSWAARGTSSSSSSAVRGALPFQRLL